MRETILVADPNIQFLDKTRVLLERQEYTFVQAMSGEEAQFRLKENQIDMCLINAALPGIDGPRLCHYIRKDLGKSIPVALMIGQGEQMPSPEELELAEGLLMRPLSFKELMSCIHHLRIIRHLVEQNKNLLQQAANAPKYTPPPISQVENKVSEQNKSSAAGENPEDTPLYPMSWFRKLAALEVKRAIRFHQPLSLLLMAYDMTDEYLQSCPEDKLNLLSQKLAEAVRDVIRDIDIPVQFSQDHILILLPNTGIEGTIQEASRIKQEISLVLQREISTKYGDIPTISIGATTSSVQEAFKFTDLLRDATRALREIRAQGGDGVFYC
jgi:diguanylate cyclase (GGDEF)-like protein